MPNDSRPVDLLNDSKGAYGIGIVYDKGGRKLYESDKKHLIFRPDILAQLRPQADNRETLLQTVPDHRFLLTHEWSLHEIMLDEALRRNPRYQYLEKELEVGQGRKWWEGDGGKLYRKVRWGQHKRQLINLNG